MPPGDRAVPLKLLTIPKAAAELPCATETAYRYIRNGTRDGVFLRYTAVGEKLFTTREWIERFRNECAAARERRLAQARERRKPPTRYGGLTLPSHEEAVLMFQTKQRRRA